MRLLILPVLFLACFALARPGAAECPCEIQKIEIYDPMDGSNPVVPFFIKGTSENAFKSSNPGVYVQIWNKSTEKVIVGGNAQLNKDGSWQVGIATLEGYEGVVIIQAALNTDNGIVQTSVEVDIGICSVRRREKK